MATNKSGKITLTFEHENSFKMAHSNPSQGPNPSGGFVETAVNLQKTWTAVFATRAEVRGDQQREVLSRGKSALNELLQAGTTYEQEKFFKKLVLLCITLSGLGHPQSSAVVKETYPALRSVLKSGDVQRIIDLPRTDKEHHLLELIQIVMGIRLFNKDSHKGGEGIDDLPELLTQALNVSKTQLKDALKITRSRYQKLGTFLRLAYLLDENQDNSGVLQIQPGFSPKEVKKVKTMLCLSWIQNSYLRILNDEISESEGHVTFCVNQLGDTLLQLHETVRYRVAIPTVQVYPLFVQLSLVWRELQYEAAALGQISRMVKIVISSLEQTSDDSPGKKSANPAKTVRFLQQPPSDELKYRGFCPWTILQSDGVVIPGCHVINDIAFRSVACGEAWMNDPHKAHLLMTEVLESHPEIQLFLGITATTLHGDKNSTATKKRAQQTTEAEVQTDVHPVESYIDPNYIWSEWNLKKKSVQLAKISFCLTKSQQTSP